MKLSAGCYRMDLTAVQAVGSGEESFFTGTFRVTERKNDSKASGDLYRSRGGGDGFGKSAPPPKTGNRIPHFLIEDYRFYLEGLETPTADDGKSAVKMRVRIHKANLALRKMIPGGIFEMRLGTKDDGASWSGTLQTGSRVEAKVSLSLIRSDVVRSADLRILRTLDSVQSPRWSPAMGSPSGESRDWEAIFAKAKWDLDAKDVPMDMVLAELRKKNVWSVYDLGLQSLELRKSCPQANWTVDLICVGEIGRDSHLLGLMFDSDAVDLDHKPRESAAVAAFQKVILPESLAVGGKETPLLQEYLGGAAYYRTALHEVGHAFNLVHNFREGSLMNTTQFVIDQLPAKPKSEVPFQPVWAFSDEEVDWLQHAPDLAVRPGGILRRGIQLQDQGTKLPPAISTRAVTSMELRIDPVKPLFPLGAPVRLDYVLKNHGASARVPRDLSLGSGFITGHVRGPDFRTRTFRSVYRSCGAMTSLHRMKTLKPGGSERGSMTLLEGVHGALFPFPGRYEIELELHWDVDGEPKRLRQRVHVDVAPPDPTDPIQPLVVERVLKQSSLNETLIQGLLNPQAGETLSLALRSEILQPHFLPLALKCLSLSPWGPDQWQDFFQKLGEIGAEYKAPQISNSEVVTEHWERKVLMPWLRKLNPTDPQSHRWASLQTDALTVGKQRSETVGNGSIGTDENIAVWIEAFKQATFPRRSKGSSGPAQPPSDGMKSGAA